jgi:transcriptional regulator with AAA-type ATPase domain
MITNEDQRLATEISSLVYANPFLEERIESEQRILGDAFIASQPFWSFEPDRGRTSNVELIQQKVADLIERQQQTGALSEDVAVYFLYERYRETILECVEQPGRRVTFYPRFQADVVRHLGEQADAAHLFACFFQVRRAFHHIFENIVGRSLPAARLRAAVWQSIFTHDMRRFRRSVFARMGDVPTLITGPTGTGKELVARAIGLSRYVPFDEKRERFAGDSTAFVGLNPSALAPAVIESELFGHRKGAFTGAFADREGFLESTGPYGTVFLDEIGELEPAMQVKLLRVMQTRTFQRLGDTASRRFEGKLIAATNRDLAAEIQAGRFREDFFYRLCADTIATPTLHEQLAGNEDEIEHLVRFVSARVAGEGEADALTAEVVSAIERSPGRDYRWPGNFRELEQCVRSVMLRGSYEPAVTPVARDARQRIAGGVLAGAFTADDLLRNYCTLLYGQMRNYSQVAERLGIDRRTVRVKVDADLLREL